MTLRFGARELLRFKRILAPFTLGRYCQLKCVRSPLPVPSVGHRFSVETLIHCRTAWFLALASPYLDRIPRRMDYPSYRRDHLICGPLICVFLRNPKKISKIKKITTSSSSLLVDRKYSSWWPCLWLISNFFGWQGLISFKIQKR